MAPLITREDLSLFATKVSAVICRIMLLHPPLPYTDRLNRVPHSWYSAQCLHSAAGTITWQSTITPSIQTTKCLTLPAVPPTQARPLIMNELETMWKETVLGRTWRSVAELWTVAIGEQHCVRCANGRAAGTNWTAEVVQVLCVSCVKCSAAVAVSVLEIMCEM